MSDAKETPKERLERIRERVAYGRQESEKPSFKDDMGVVHHPPIRMIHWMDAAFLLDEIDTLSAMIEDMRKESDHYLIGVKEGIRKAIGRKQPLVQSDGRAWWSQGGRGAHTIHGPLGDLMRIYGTIDSIHPDEAKAMDVLDEAIGMLAEEPHER